jgi:hypothetical protein
MADLLTCLFSSVWPLSAAASYTCFSPRRLPHPMGHLRNTSTAPLTFYLFSLGTSLSGSPAHHGPVILLG